jgi:hypothetical protein
VQNTYVICEETENYREKWLTNVNRNDRTEKEEGSE